MNAQIKEALAKSVQTAELLESDLRELRKRSKGSLNNAEVGLIRDCFDEVSRIATRLEDILNNNK